MSKIITCIGLTLTVANFIMFNNDFLLLLSMHFMASLLGIISPILLILSIIFLTRGEILFGFLGVVFALASFFTAPGILFLIDILGFERAVEFIENMMMFGRLGRIIS
jgi:voltage-gated potassium channel Kch